MTIPVLELHGGILHWTEKDPPPPSGGEVDEHTLAIGRERGVVKATHPLSCLLQVDVLGRAGVLQVLLVILLEGPPGEKDTVSSEGHTMERQNKKRDQSTT